MTEKPVLYYVGPGVKPTVPDRDLYAADLRRRSKEALLASGLYSETDPNAKKAKKEPPAAPEPEAASEPEATPTESETTPVAGEPETPDALVETEAAKPRGARRARSAESKP